MKYSFSLNRIFRTCQRWWYYTTLFKSSKAKDPLRHEAFLLSKLQSVPAWRGDLVDYVIERRVVTALKNGWSLNLDQILAFARTVFDKQLAFAKAHRLREPGMSESKDKESFAAFYAVEYGEGVSDEEVEKAWREIVLALTNLLGMQDLLATLGTATHLVAQRPLKFTFDGINIIAVPDLIAFFDNSPPLIVDWKVHAFATSDYRLQLTTYAVALTRCRPHKDFPESLSEYGATDIRLIEAQLLTNRQREYALTDIDIEEFDSFVAVSAAEMVLACGDNPKGQLNPFDFPVTSYPEACQRCPFRKPCWEDSEVQEVSACQGLKQMSFL